MNSIMKFIAVSVLLYSLLLVLLIPNQLVSETYHHVEDFTTKQYCDISYTTALWDTVSNELKLPPFELTLVGSYDTPDNAYGVAISGDYVYLGDAYSGLQVIDISDPANPVLAGSHDTPGVARGVAISGNYAYVADGHKGLQVIDISDPTNPTFAGSYPAVDGAMMVAVTGDYAYMTNWYSGLLVIDISDPTNPVLVGNCDTPGNAFGIDIAGDYAYVGDSNGGLQVIDISDPTNPELAGSYGSIGTVGGVAVAGDYVYVASGDLDVIDISDPTNPTLAGNCEAIRWAENLFVVGDYAYVVCGGVGLQVINISDPTNPVLTVSLDTPHYAAGVAIAGDYAYVADKTSGLQVIHIADPVLPPHLVSFCDAGYSHGIAMSGDYIYLATGVSGVQVVCISDPANPVHVGGCSTNYAQDFAIAGDYTYLSDYREGLKVLDISDPTHPTVIGSCDTPGLTRMVDVSGNYAYITDGDFGLQVIDISDPFNPTLVGNWGTPGLQDIVVSGDLAYVVVGADGLQVLDISDPANPILIGSHDTPGHAGGIVVGGNYAYVADGVPGLQVFDISDPTSPVLVGNIDTWGNAFNVAVTGDYVFLASYHGGLQMIDVSDPTNPVLLGHYDTERAYNTVISGDYAYVADGPSSLQVIEVFQRRFNLQNNVAQSLEIDDTDAEIIRAKLTTVQTDSILWEMSADGGLNWQEIIPDGNWYDFMFPGHSLIWRSSHTYTRTRVNPTCGSLTISWEFFPAEFGLVTGQIRADCPTPNTPLCGVIIDAYEEGTGNLVGTAVTDVNGAYVIDSLEANDYTVTIMTPLSYNATSEEIPITIVGDDTVVVDFPLSCVDVTANPRSIGYWKHQIGVATGGKGEAQIGAATLCDYLDLIEAHFNGNAINEVIVYQPPFSGECSDKLVVAKELLNLKGSVAMVDRAKQQLMALLFNVVTEYIGLMEIISEDGATVSQAITYCDQMIDDGDAGNDEQAKDVADMINNAMIVPEGMIPLSTSNIAYALSRFGKRTPNRLSVEQNYPNPFNPSTMIRYYLPEECHVTLRIYDAAGRRVARLVDKHQVRGRHSVVWNGLDGNGRTVGAGIYFLRLKAGGVAISRKMILLR